MTSTTNAPTDPKWGLSPSIRESILTSQAHVGKKITSVIRIVLVSAVICVVFLGANFALTVTAVVSNKDVYVSSSKGLVDGNGEQLSVAVAQQAHSIFDLPYQHPRVLVDTDAVIVPDGENMMILYPASFEYSRVEEGYQLKMKANDGTTLTWGPPTMLTPTGALTKPSGTTSIQVTRADGTSTRKTAGPPQTRRLPSWYETTVHHAGSSWGKANPIYNGAAYEMGCTTNVKGHQQRAYGFHPDGDNLVPFAVYLCGTGMSMAMSMGGGNPVATGMITQMADRGFMAANLEYDNDHFPQQCVSSDGDRIGWQAKAQEVGDCIHTICINENVLDCNLGVAVYGWSQGGILALLAHDKNTIIQAALSFDGTVQNMDSSYDETWNADHDAQHQLHMKAEMTNCYAQSTLDKSKRRILVADQDGIMGGSVKGQVSGGSAAENIHNAAIAAKRLGDTDCNGGSYEGVYNCLNKGAGYYVVTHQETQLTMGHDWFAVASRWGYSGLQSTFTDDTTHEWGAQKTFDWLSLNAKTGGH